VIGDRNLLYKSSVLFIKTGVSEMLFESDNNQKRVIQEVVYDVAPKHNLKKQVELHEKIRNDEDYDDWTYGTEPNYGSSWK
jgi:hypothetical protein